jgi:hypothetical protein
MPFLLPSWLYWAVSLSVRCDVRFRGWWRTVDTHTTVTVDREWVWLNINWGWFGGGVFPLQWD